MFTASALLYWPSIPISDVSTNLHYWSGSPLSGCNLLLSQTQQELSDAEQPTISRTQPDFPTSLFKIAITKLFPRLFT
jgi:hypothetical protein